MGLDLQGQRLQGRSFRGQDLAGADFSGADIGGVDFRDANLTGADFRQAQAGLSQRSSIGYRVGAVLAATLTGAILGATASLTTAISEGLQEGVPPGWQVALVALALIALLALLTLLIKRGLRASLLGTIAFATIPLLLAAIPGTPPAAPGIGVFLLLLFSGLLAGSVLLAIDLVTLHSIAGWHWMAAQLVLAALVAAPAIWETTVEFGNPKGLTRVNAVELSIAALVAMLLFALGIYIARCALAGDARFALVHVAAVGLLSRAGTRFRDANLTDANFGEAIMTHADLRGAILTRADWLGARQLDRARLDGVYLANPKLRQLATTKNGAGQDYDDLNLEGLNLRAAKLANASFVGANLSLATLQLADLSGAKLAHTQLHDTDLSEACLTGAFIEHWGVSDKTRFDDVRCDYVYMHLPTAADPDPMRKPDDNADFFQAGDFTDFIAPFIRTLEYYHRQHTDPRSVTRAAKTLDLMQRDAIDPAASALALQQLAQRHPEANLEIVSLKAKGGEKVQIRALVSDKAQRSEMSEEFQTLYTAMTALPKADLERVLSNIVHKDEQIRQLEAMVLAAVTNDSFYVETRIKPGGTVKCLMFAANPLQTEQLRLDVEFREITAKLRSSEYRDVFQLIPILAARPDDLLQALNEHRPKIVQFSGHGAKTGELIFLDDHGYAKAIPPNALRALFTTLKDDVRLVILNACYSEIQAQAIAEIIDCVVGMSDAIADDAATIFIASFYRALGFGRSVQNAFEQGLVALRMEDLTGIEAPRLLTRRGVDPAQVLLVAPDLLSTGHQGNG
jgi:uncharacterized protein YjbI with pentapeptide repeats